MPATARRAAAAARPTHHTPRAGCRYARSRARTPGEEVGQSLVLCRPGSSLSEVVAMLVASKVHRVYVVDEQERPVGVVTITDVLRKLVELTH
jgi:CBS domain-containing protein